jgi:hypothetical protein
MKRMRVQPLIIRTHWDEASDRFPHGLKPGSLVNRNKLSNLVLLMFPWFGVLLYLASRLINRRMAFYATRHAQGAMSRHELPEPNNCEIIAE